MGRIYNLKAIINKANGQINISIPKKKIPSALKEVLKKDPTLIKFFKMRLEGWE